MSADCFSQHIECALAVCTNVLLELDSASSSDGDGQPLANAGGADNISNRLQKLLRIRAELSDSSDSSDGVSNPGSAGKKKKLNSQVRRLWLIVSTHQRRRIAVILRMNLYPILQGWSSSTIQVMFVGDATRDNDAGESPK